MNVQRLGQRLQREAKANPKKTAVLGLLGLVAVWFWGPLVWGWVGPKEETAVAASTVTPVAPVPAGLPQPAAGNQPGQPEVAWQRLVEWMEQDLRTVPQAEVPGRPDPFCPVESEVAKAQGENAKELAEKEALPPDPVSLGLSVTSTMVGSARRVALISGKAYRLGENVTVSVGDRTATFRLIDVSADGIVLEREGKRFEMSLPKPQISGRLEILAEAPRQTP